MAWLNSTALCPGRAAGSGVRTHESAQGTGRVRRKILPLESASRRAEARARARRSGTPRQLEKLPFGRWLSNAPHAASRLVGERARLP